jgi:hypothetical protein
LIDGKGVGDVGRSVLKERRVLSEEGLVVVNMAFDEETGIVVYGPDIVSRGFVFETETGYLLQDAQCVILEIVEDVTPDVPNRVDQGSARIANSPAAVFLLYHRTTAGDSPLSGGGLRMKKEIVGILFFFMVVFSLISLLSFVSNDPCLFFNAGGEGRVQNFFGVFGANFAGILIGLFGIGAFWIPFLFLLGSILFFSQNTAVCCGRWPSGGFC